MFYPKILDFRGNHRDQIAHLVNWQVKKFKLKKVK